MVCPRPTQPPFVAADRLCCWPLSLFALPSPALCCSDCMWPRLAACSATLRPPWLPAFPHLSRRPPLPPHVSPPTAARPDYMAEARNVFRNPATTEFVIVTIPTAMAAAESIRLAKALKEEQVGGWRVGGGWLEGEASVPAAAAAAAAPRPADAADAAAAASSPGQQRVCGSVCPACIPTPWVSGAARFP